MRKREELTRGARFSGARAKALRAAKAAKKKAVKTAPKKKPVKTAPKKQGSTTRTGDTGSTKASTTSKKANNGSGSTTRIGANKQNKNRSLFGNIFGGTFTSSRGPNRSR